MRMPAPETTRTIRETASLHPTPGTKVLQTEAVIGKQMAPQGRIKTKSSRQASRLPKGLKMTVNPTKDKHMISHCLVTMVVMVMKQTTKNQRRVIAMIKVMDMVMRMEKTSKMNLQMKRKSQREARHAKRQQEQGARGRWSRAGITWEDDAPSGKDARKSMPKLQQ